MTSTEPLLESSADEPSSGRVAYVRVLITEGVVLLALYLFSRYFQ